MTTQFIVPRKRIVVPKNPTRYMQYKNWLWGYDVPNSGDNIYYCDPSNQKGYGGSELTFILFDGKKITVKGPWHVTSSELYKATGHDLRNKHLTFGVLARKLTNSIYSDIIHLDESPVSGKFDRIIEIGEKIEGEVVYWVETCSGRSQGMIT